MPARAALLARLLEVLEPQLPVVSGQWPVKPSRLATHDSGLVELLIRQSDPALPVGENREILRQASCGEYISFIDDDDLVPPHFVERIRPALDGVDYVGFNLEQRMDGQFACIERRSLKFSGVGRDHAGENRYRDISHVNPMRRELALRVPMSGWPGEDTRWADALRELKIVQSEHYLDETLYYYLTRTHKPELE